MLLDWLKKDFSKDVVAVREISASMTRGRGLSLLEHGLAVAAAGAAAFVGAAIVSRFPAVAHEDEEVPYGDQAGLNHWHDHQWD